VSRRLLLAYVTLTAVVLAVLVIPLGVANARGERRDLEAKVERDAHAVASISEDALETGDTALVPAISRVAADYSARTGGRVVVVDGSGVSIVDGGGPAGRSFASRPEIARALRGDVAVGTRASETLGTRLVYVAVPVASSGVVHGAVRITYPTSTLDARVRRYWLLLAAVAAVALVLAAALGVWLARWASKPLVRLERAAVVAAEGDLDARAPVEGPPEVRSVAIAFNEMVARLDGLVTTQRAFVADASHQLRTPLTALRLRLENLERDVGEDGRADLGAAVAEVGRLSGLVEGLLAIARADAGNATPERLALAPVVASRVDAWTALADERGTRLELAMEPTPAIRAVRERVEQTLDNLVSNALAVGATRVDVALRSVDGTVEVTVRDDGPGMSDDDKEHAFDRFWRRREGPGSGLGLAIAKRLVEADGGTIALEDAPGGGLEAVVRFRADAGR
jgi:signal transduction histidine kinase